MMIQIGSPARFGRLFWLFNHHVIAWCGLRMKSKCSPRRVSAPLAPTGRCANLRQNDRHHSTDLPRCDHLPPAFPGTIAGLSQRACQQPAVHHDPNTPTPAFKLLWSAYMDLCPQQVLLQVAVAVFMRKAPPIAAHDLWQGNADRMVIKADKPTLAGVTFAAFGSVTLGTEDTN